MAALRPITSSPPLPVIDSSDWETKINVFAQNQLKDRSDVRACLEYKHYKKDLKEAARKGELSKELRWRILEILSKIGLRTVSGDPRFRGMPVQLTEILFFSPRLWKIFVHPELFPDECRILRSLSDDVFKVLVGVEKLKEASLEKLVQLKNVAIQLGISELEESCTELIKSEIKSRHVGRLSSRTLYQIASLWHENDALFSQLLKELPSSLHRLLSTASSKEIAKEFEKFKVMAQQGSFPPEPQELYRFFFFIYADENTQTLTAFNELLNHFRQGALDPSLLNDLLEWAEHSYPLRERLKKDRLKVILEGVGSVTLCPWHIFAKSGYVQGLLKNSSMSRPSVINLSVAISESYFLLYDLMAGREKKEGKEVVYSTLSFEQLWGLLQGAQFFDIQVFDETRKEIAQAIILKIGESEENIAALSERLNLIHCSELEEHVLSLLKRNPLFSFRGEDGKCIVTISISAVPFATLKNSLRTLKSMRVIHPEWKVNLHENYDFFNNICDVYCCHVLGLAEEKAVLQKRLLTIYIPNLDSSRWTENLSPIDMIFLLGILDANISSRILEETRSKSSHFWQSVCTLGSVQNPTERDEFEFIVTDRTGNKALELSAAQLPRFLYYLAQREKENPIEERETLVASLSKVISRCIQEKSLNFEAVKTALADCQKFCPEQVTLLNRLQIGIAPGLQFSLQLIVKAEIGPQIFEHGKLTNEFDQIPGVSIQWAADFLDRVLCDYSDPISGPRTFQPSDFRALELLQKGVINQYSKEPLKTKGNDFVALVSSFSRETLLSAASWAASIDHVPLMDRCSSLFCYDKTLLHEKEEGGGAVKLRSLYSTPLQFLRAIGSEVQNLHIDVEPAAGVTEEVWSKVVDACPNLYHFTLYIKGKGPSLASMPLSRLNKLNYLTINPRDSDCWESLRHLRIPAKVDRTHLFIKMDQITKATPYEFFDHLPESNVLISLDLESEEPKPARSFWSNFIWSPYEVDPLVTFFSHLAHCKEISLDSRKNDCMYALLPTMPLLEKVKFDYQDKYPSIQILINLLTQPQLRDCEITIHLFDAEAKKQKEIFLKELESHLVPLVSADKQSQNNRREKFYEFINSYKNQKTSVKLKINTY